MILLTAAFFLDVGTATAQTAPRPKIGVGFNAVLSSTEGLGVGVRGRAAWPVNADLSLAVGTGMTGFVLEGRDEATYLLDPQVSVIVTMGPQGPRTPYFLGGVGAAIPVNNKTNAESGPTLHFGIGWVQGLRDTILFYEVDPTMLVGETEISFVIPFRIGVIF
ncbi:MAG: hypothetical protein HKN29_07205 [Rhodothermales bacterium]|nr:hypothetical protein [Rhodothermales bacterium]